MMGAILFLAFLIVQRLSELVIAKRNTAALMAQGAVEHGASHYPFIVALHTAWILALVVLGWDQPLTWGWLAVFAVLQVGRVWILTTLNDTWIMR